MVFCTKVDNKPGQQLSCKNIFHSIHSHTKSSNTVVELLAARVLVHSEIRVVFGHGSVDVSELIETTHHGQPVRSRERRA